MTNIKESCVTEVRMYSSGAQITRKVVATVPAGDSLLRIPNLCPDIDAASVSAVAAGAEVNSAVFTTTYLQDAAVAPKNADTEKKLEAAKDELAVIDSKISVLEFEKEVLNSNRVLVGSKTGVMTEELKTAAAYLKKSFETNQQDNLKLVKAKKDKVEEIKKLELELGSFKTRPIPSGVIYTELSAKKAGDIEITLNYYIGKASWTPFYEVRGEEGKEKVILKLKGEITQQTGENWENVKLILSQGNPSTSIGQPELSPWYLRVVPPVIPVRRYEMEKVKVKMSSVMREEVEEFDDLSYESYLEEAAEVVENPSGAEFVMNDPVFLPSHDKRTFVVAAHECAAAFTHFAISKRDKDVFLLARISDWQKLNLIAAPVNVFYGAAFVGRTVIRPGNIKDALEISFGRDKGVIATRIKGRDFSGKQIFGSNTKTSVSFNLTVKNTKKTPIDLILTDQLPVSTDKTITVEPVEITGAKHNKDTGELVWNIKLKPAEETSKIVKYAVTYPSSTEVILE